MCFRFTSSGFKDLTSQVETQGHTLPPLLVDPLKLFRLRVQLLVPLSGTTVLSRSIRKSNLFLLSIEISGLLGQTVGKNSVKKLMHARKSHDFSKWLVHGLCHLLINQIYWGYNPLILTFDPNFQRDILVVFSKLTEKKTASGMGSLKNDAPGGCRILHLLA